MKKININREKISSEEIAKRRDFNSLMKSYTVVKKPFWKHWSFISGTSALVLGAVATLVYLNLRSSNDVPSNKDQKDQTTQSDFTYDHQDKFIGNAPFINPPLRGVDVAFTDYTVDAGKATDLKYKTGSSIKIPKDAFKDEKGNLVKGKVDVRYREMHDAVDFALSGIPMTYDSAGNKFVFESAGMVEMYAFQDGKVLKMNPEKLIRVEMRTNTDAAGYNVYSLDTTARNWVYEGKDKIKRDKKQEINIKDTLNSNSIPVFVSKDKPHADQLQVEIKQVQQEIVKLNDTKPVQPKKANPKKQTFNVDVDPKEFPEIAVYKNVFFEVGDENKDFTPEMYKITWDDAVISEGTTKGSYIITLTKGKEKHKVVTYPVFEGKGFEDANKEFSNKFSEYTTKLNTKKELEKQKQLEYDALVQQIKQQQVEYEKKVIEERKKQQELYEKQIESWDAGQKIYRVFTMNDFGVYNCDSPQKFPHGATVNATFQLDKGETIARYNVVYLVDRQKNGVFMYNCENRSADKLEFDPGHQNLLWSLLPDKRLAVFFDEQFKDVKTSGAVNFQMKIYSTDEVKTTEQIKSLLRIGKQELSKK